MDEQAARLALALAASLAFGANAAPLADPAPSQYSDVVALELLPDPPIANGAVLGPLLTSQPAGPGQITLMYTGGAASGPEKRPLTMGGGAAFNKTSPEASPSSYKNLAYTAIAPCRIYDSRPAYGGAGTWSALSTNTVNIGPVVNYTSQGGSATDCGLGALISAGKIAAVMASVTTVTPAANGFLTFFSYLGTNPFPNGVSQFYQAGGIGTAFVVMPTDLNAAVKVSGYTTKLVDVVIDMVGYFAKPPAQVMAGKIVNPGGQNTCLAGAALGVTQTAACSGPGLANVGVGAPAGYYVRNFTARATTALSVMSPVYLMAYSHDGTTGEILLQCYISSGFNTCTNILTSSAIQADRVLVVEFDGNYGGAAIAPIAFTYELVAP